MDRNKYIPIKHELLSSAPYILLSLTDAEGLLTLRLESTEGTKINVCFDGYIFYSKMDEGDALRTVSALKKNSCIGETLIKAPTSELLTWFNQENLDVRSKSQLIHYVILTLDDVVNIISLDSPIISAE